MGFQTKLSWAFFTLPLILFIGIALFASGMHEYRIQAPRADWYETTFSYLAAPVISSYVCNCDEHSCSTCWDIDLSLEYFSRTRGERISVETSTTGEVFLSDQEEWIAGWRAQTHTKLWYNPDDDTDIQFTDPKINAENARQLWLAGIILIALVTVPLLIGFIKLQHKKEKKQKKFWKKFWKHTEVTTSGGWSEPNPYSTHYDFAPKPVANPYTAYAAPPTTAPYAAKPMDIFNPDVVPSHAQRGMGTRAMPKSPVNVHKLLNFDKLSTISLLVILALVALHASLLSIDWYKFEETYLTTASDGSTGVANSTRLYFAAREGASTIKSPSDEHSTIFSYDYDQDRQVALVFRTILAFTIIGFALSAIIFFLLLPTQIPDVFALVVRKLTPNGYVMARAGLTLLLIIVQITLILVPLRLTEAFLEDRELENCKYYSCRFNGYFNDELGTFDGITFNKQVEWGPDVAWFLTFASLPFTFILLVLGLAENMPTMGEIDSMASMEDGEDTV